MPLANCLTHDRVEYMSRLRRWVAGEARAKSNDRVRLACLPYLYSVRGAAARSETIQSGQPAIFEHPWKLNLQDRFVMWYSQSLIGRQNENSLVYFGMSLQPANTSAT